MVVSTVDYGTVTRLSTRDRGHVTQARILDKAVHIASVEGLEAMSLATLAKATGMSKSGLFAHFRSKEALQIAIIGEAQQRFFAAVIAPLDGTSGGERLTKIVERYVDLSARGLFDGGCFFAAAAHEFDGRVGPVRDRVVSFFDTWHTELRCAIDGAKKTGEVAESFDADAFVFAVQGIGFSTNLTRQLLGSLEGAQHCAAVAVKALLADTLVARN